MTRNGHSEARLLARFRLVTIGILLFCFAIYVIAGIFQLPGLRPDFHLEPAILGLFLGAILPLVGVEVLSRVAGIARPKEDSDDS